MCVYVCVCVCVCVCACACVYVSVVLATCISFLFALLCSFIILLDIFDSYISVCHVKPCLLNMYFVMCKVERERMTGRLGHGL